MLSQQTFPKSSQFHLPDFATIVAFARVLRAHTSEVTILATATSQTSAITQQTKVWHNLHATGVRATISSVMLGDVVWVDAETARVGEATAAGRGC